MTFDDISKLSYVNDFQPKVYVYLARYHVLAISAVQFIFRSLNISFNVNKICDLNNLYIVRFNMFANKFF